REFDRVAPIKLWVLIEPIAQQTDPPSRSFNCLEIAQQDPLVHVKAGSSLQGRARQVSAGKQQQQQLQGVVDSRVNKDWDAFVPPTQPESVTGPGFTARLDNQRDLPKFRAKGVEYVVRITNTEDLREVFADMLEVFKQDLAVMTLWREIRERQYAQSGPHSPVGCHCIVRQLFIRLLKAWVPRGGCALENKHLEERHAFSKHYVRITNSDKRCLLRALVVACAYLQFVAKSITEKVWRTIKANSPKQTKLVAELQIEAGASTRLFKPSRRPVLSGGCTARSDPCPEPAASRPRFWCTRVPGQRRPTGASSTCLAPRFCTCTWSSSTLMWSPSCLRFFGSDHYCAKCEMAYDCANAEHKCADACSTCKTPGSNCKANRAYVRCHDCGLNCYNAQCLENHKRKNKAGRSRCDSVHVCGTCGYLEELKVGQPPEHQCGYAKCPVCKQYDETATHECFVTPPKAKESSAPYVYYDFETYVDSGKQHRVHLVTAATSCEACPKLFPRPRCSVCGGLHSSANCIAGRDLALDFTSCVSHNDCAYWLAKQEGQVFNFNKEYLDYCLQDTLILREGCLKYRLIKDICGLDAFVQSQHHCGLGYGCFHHQVYGAQHSWGVALPRLSTSPYRQDRLIAPGHASPDLILLDCQDKQLTRTPDARMLRGNVVEPQKAHQTKALQLGYKLAQSVQCPGLLDAETRTGLFCRIMLWGKFCQRDDLTSTEIVDSYEAPLEIKVKFVRANWERLHRCFEYKPRFLAAERCGREERACGSRRQVRQCTYWRFHNLPTPGCDSTSLWRGLGTSVIYADTDFGRIPLLPGEYEPPGGSSLGQWTDEGGPKLYRYGRGGEARRRTGRCTRCSSAKGIRVTPEISEREDELQEILRHGGTVRLPQAQFRRDKASCTIRTLEMDKTFQRVYNAKTSSVWVPL
uniref:DNA-directed DNA polymerase n=1 Tax=Macrostomum lignano TaxID=282301 RepID=A0A1I8JPH7_9PLAT